MSNNRDSYGGLDVLALTNIALPDGLYVLPADLERQSGGGRAGDDPTGRWLWLRRALDAARRWYLGR